MIFETFAGRSALEGGEADLALDALGFYVRLQLTLRILLRILRSPLTLLRGFVSVTSTHC